MSEEKFTPWAVNPFNAQVDEMRESGPVPVCQLLWPTKERSEEETQANANLIAAAPMMYEALNQAVTSMQDSGYPNSHVAVLAARYALAKARGKQFGKTIEQYRAENPAAE